MAILPQELSREYGQNIKYYVLREHGKYHPEWCRYCTQIPFVVREGTTLISFVWTVCPDGICGEWAESSRMAVDCTVVQQERIVPDIFCQN